MAVRRRISRVVSATWATLFAVRVAAAQAEAPPGDSAPSSLPTVDAALELDAPEGCGTEAALSFSITRRSDRIRIDPTSPRRLHIEIRAEAQLTRVVLTLSQPSGRHSTRTLRASSCDEALEAAALVAAVSLDPAASAALEPAPEPPPEKPKPTKLAAPPPPPPAPPPARLSVGAALYGEALWGPAPSALPGAGIMASIGWDRRAVLSPVVRLRVGLASRGGFEPGPGTSGTVTFRVIDATLELCPLRFGVSMVAVLACAMGSGGQLWAAGRQTTGTQDHGEPWAAVGGSAVLAFRPVPSIELQAFSTVGGVLNRPGYEFSRPEENIHIYIHRVGTVARAVGGAVGIAFP